MNAKSVLGLPGHGGTVGRIRCPFKGLMGSDAERYPLTHNFQCGSRCGVPTLDIDCDGGGYGIKGVLYGYPEDVILILRELWIHCLNVSILDPVGC